MSAQEAPDGNRPGAAEAELRSFLRTHRTRLPRVLAASLLVGALAFSLYALAIALLAVADPELAWTLAGYLALVIAGGREPAMLLAYQELGGDALPWLAAVAVLGDIGIVLVGVPFLAWGFERLRDARGFRAFLLSVERQALEHRERVQRWGPPALLGFVAIPAWGTGPLVAGAIGLMARLRPMRLLAVLVAAVAIVNITWAVLLAGAHAAIPTGGLWRFLPAALLVLVVLAAVVSTWRGTRARDVLVRVDRPELVSAEHAAMMSGLGIRFEAGLVRADVRRLSAALGFARLRPETCRAVAELLLLPVATPEDAYALATVGVRSIHDLALAPPELVTAALRERGVSGRPASAWSVRAVEWREHARAFEAPPGASGPAAA